MASTVSAFWIRIFIWATNEFPFRGPELTVFFRFRIEKFLVPFTNLNISSNITPESIDTRKLSVVSFLIQDYLHLKRSRQNKRFSDHLNLMLVCRRVRKPEEESQEETSKEEKEPALFLPQARLFRILLAFQQIQHWLEVRSACRLDRSGHLLQTVCEYHSFSFFPAFWSDTAWLHF